MEIEKGYWDEVAKYRRLGISDFWRRRNNIINGLPFFSEKSGLTISPCHKMNHLNRFCQNIILYFGEKNRKLRDRRHLNLWTLACPDDSWDEGQASSLQTFQTASKLLTWLVPNQDFTITLENLNIFTDWKIDKATIKSDCTYLLTKILIVFVESNPLTESHGHTRKSK